MKINPSLASLPAGYLFAEVAKRVKEYSALNPDADILRLGIGDVTRPLAPAVVDALKAAADEMGTPEGFHGYGPDFGYDFLIDAIIAGDYLSRGVQIGRDEVFVSDGAKSDVGNLQELFGPDALIAVTGTSAVAIIIIVVVLFVHNITIIRAYGRFYKYKISLKNKCRSGESTLFMLIIISIRGLKQWLLCLYRISERSRHRIHIPVISEIILVKYDLPAVRIFKPLLRLKCRTQYI